MSSLVLHCLQREVVQLELSGIQLIAVLHKTVIKLHTRWNLPNRPAQTQGGHYGRSAALTQLRRSVPVEASVLPVLQDEVLILAVRIDGR